MLMLFSISLSLSSDPATLYDKPEGDSDEDDPYTRIDDGFG